MIGSLLCLLAFAGAGQDKIAELARGLTEAVDRTELASRHAAVITLASRKDVSIDEWSRAIALVTFVRADDSPQPPEYACYVPHTWDPKKPAPLLLAFHGTGGSGKDVEPMWRETAEALGMLVLAPSETGANDGYAFSARERNAALAALRWMRTNYDVDANRIYATGISRGGHLSWDLALRHPDLFAAIAPMIGGPRFQLDHGQNNLRFLENVANLPIRDLQGAKDDPGLIANLLLAFQRLGAFHAPDAQLISFPELGHAFEFDAVDWKAFFAKPRSPTPERIVLRAARADEARSFWVEITKLGADVAEDVVPKVVASTWNGLSESARRKLLEEEVEKRTARLEIRTTGVGRFAAQGYRVAAFRLLLPASMFDAARPVQIVFDGKLVEKKPKPDARVLLDDFVERLDRTFLPVVAVDVP